MLIAKKNKFLSQEYTIEKNDIIVSKINWELFSKNKFIDFVYNKKHYQVHQTHPEVFKEFHIESEAEIISCATRPNVTEAIIYIQVGDSKYTLRRKSLVSSTFTIFEGEKQIGVIKGGGSGKLLIDLPENIPIPLQVFIFFVFLAITGQTTNLKLQLFYQILGYSILGTVVYILHITGWGNDISDFCKKANIDWFVIPAVLVFIGFTIVTKSLYKHCDKAIRAALISAIISSIALIIIFSINITITSGLFFLLIYCFPFITYVFIKGIEKMR